jgi:uncharacterized delta-60 repeat protein
MSTHKKLHCASLLMVSILFIASRQAAAQAGQLDPTFGQGGVVTTDFGNQRFSQDVATATAVVIQSDGKIVVCGGAPTTTDFPEAVVARYNPDGSLDTSFGTGGMTVTDTFAIPTAIALQPDGKIVVDGAEGETVSVTRYTSTGSLDTTFGSGGTASFIGFGGITSGVLVQRDGKIVVANNGLARFLSNGQLDSSFGTGGSVKVAGFTPTAVALVANEKYLVASASAGLGSNQAAAGYVTRFSSNGSLDATFGIGGQLATAGPANAMVLLSSGEILIGGSLITSLTQLNEGFGPSTGFTASRYQGSGATDAKFGKNGGVLTALTTSYPNVLTSGLGVESTGDIVVLGTGADIQSLAFALVRYTSAGQLDSTFGTGGIVITSFGTTSANASALAIQSDDKIVAVGNYTISEGGVFDTGFKLTRYLAN